MPVLQSHPFGSMTIELVYSGNIFRTNSCPWSRLTVLNTVLLSTACPTSLASDLTKGGGRPGVQRTPRFGAREQRFDLTKIQLSSKLSPKDPKEFAKKFRDATGEPREKRLLQITNLKATLQRLHRLYIYHTEKRSGRATPEIFLVPLFSNPPNNWLSEH